MFAHWPLALPILLYSFPSREQPPVLWMPKEDLSVDHIWENVNQYLVTCQGMFHHVPNSSETKVDAQCQMPNVQFLSSEI